MDKLDRIAIVNLHHGLGQCRKRAWEKRPREDSSESEEFSFREVSTIQSIYRYELTTSAPLSLNELAERIQLKKSVTSLVVTSLVDKGFVTRCLDEGNRRKIIISLTPEGRVHAEEIASFADKFLEEYLSALTPEEFRTLVNISRKLNAKFSF